MRGNELTGMIYLREDRVHCGGTKGIACSSNVDDVWRSPDGGVLMEEFCVMKRQWRRGAGSAFCGRRQKTP